MKGLQDGFGEELVRDGEKLTYGQVYERVWRWCDRNDVKPRKPNRALQNSPAKKKKTAQRCLGTINKLAEVMKRDGVSEEEVANLDETGLRLFALRVMTLHWRGDTEVPIDKGLTNKLCLSIVIIWYGNGTMDLVVVWTSPKSTRLEWANHGSVLPSPRLSVLCMAGALQQRNVVHARPTLQNDAEGAQRSKSARSVRTERCDTPTPKFSASSGRGSQRTWS